jgi:hypothetical protein
MRTWGLGQVGHVVAAVNPFEAEELAELRRATSGREYALGDLPLVVLSRSRPDAEGPDSQSGEAAHQADQALQAAMSRRSRHLRATQSGHHIPLQDPELVVRSIREILNLGRQ